MNPNPLISDFLKNPPAPAGPAPLGTTIAMPSAAPSFGAPIMPMVSRIPTQTERDVTELNRQKNTGDGISQISNPLLRGIARTADIVGSVFAPNLAQFIPGTTLHHQLTMNQQERKVQNDQTQDQATAQTADTTARTGLEQAQTDVASQGVAASKAAAAKAALSGNILYDANKNPIGYQDPTGRMMGVHDPGLPANVQDILGSVKGKTPTSEFELWQQQNPNGTAADFQQLQSKPLSKQEADSLNAVWDALATKHHLPTGQFQPGMPHADATTLASALNSAVGKQQGDVHVTIAQQNAATNAANKAPIDTTDPAMQASVNAVANGSTKLQDIFGRGATTAQKAQFVAAVKAVNPNYNSGDHDIENASRKYMISGAGGDTLTAISTARGHLVQLGAAADALKNGNIQVLNRIANELGTQTGSAAPVVFQSIKTALGGELAKAYTGGAATVSEQTEIAKALNDAQSPEQLKSFADTNIHLMDTKRDKLKERADAGAQGQANFGDSSPASAHTIQVGGKNYKYNGTGATDDMKNYTEVKK